MDSYSQNHLTETDIDLSVMDDSYSQAATETQEAVPDGTYQVATEKVELTRAKKTGTPMIKWTLRILGPRQAGRCLWKYSLLEDDTSKLKFVKADLQLCGLHLQKFSELPQHLRDLLDLKLEVKKSTRMVAGEPLDRIFFNRLIASGITPQDHGVADDDLPF